MPQHAIPNPAPPIVSLILAQVFKAHITTSPSGDVADMFWLYDNRNELPEHHRVGVVPMPCVVIWDDHGPCVGEAEQVPAGPGRTFHKPPSAWGTNGARSPTSRAVTHHSPFPSHNHNKKALEICDRVKGVLGPDTECSISLAPLDSIAEGPSLVRRKACKDAVSFSNLRSIMTRRRTAERPVPVPIPAEVSPRLAGAAAAARDAWSDRPSAVTVSVDNETSPSYTMLSLECADRKGLLYDILRALKGVDLRVAYGRLEVDEDGAGAGVTIDIFIQDNDLCRINDPCVEGFGFFAGFWVRGNGLRGFLIVEGLNGRDGGPCGRVHGGRVGRSKEKCSILSAVVAEFWRLIQQDPGPAMPRSLCPSRPLLPPLFKLPPPPIPPSIKRDALEEVKRRVELAVTLPVRITLRDVFDACCTELVVTAPLDTGGRGRPRVTFDVTQALSVAGLGVFMADGEYGPG